MPRKPRSQSDPPILPAGFLKGEKERRGRIEFLVRERLADGPGALFDAKRHRPRFPIADTCLTLIELLAYWERAGWQGKLSREEERFLSRYGEPKKTRQGSK